MARAGPRGPTADAQGRRSLRRFEYIVWIEPQDVELICQNIRKHVVGVAMLVTLQKVKQLCQCAVLSFIKGSKSNGVYDHSTCH
jgi:hypothetical protein